MVGSLCYSSMSRRAEFYSLRLFDSNVTTVLSICPKPFFQDFDGQARAENLSRIIVVLFGVVGLIWGYIIQQFSQTVYILGAGLVLATIVSLPAPIWSIIGALTQLFELTSRN